MAKKEKKNEIKIENSGSDNKKDSYDKTDEKDIVDEMLKLNSDLKTANEKNEKFEQEVSELKDTLLRKAAEFENFKRRKEAEIENLMKYAAEPFITKILTVYDDLIRAAEHTEKSAKTDSVKEGVQMVLNKFSKILDEQGVTRIKAKGEPFDFNLHEALMQQVSDDVPSHTVLDEIEAGYIYKDRVLKHSKVIVSQQSVENSSSEDEADNNKNEKE